jgi:glycosyltransferase involved in cell wall biosynthesis
MSGPPYRLLSVGHSYVVALNRKLPDEIARVSGGRWEVTAVAPRYVRSELRNITLESGASERHRVESVKAYATAHLHVMGFGARLRQILQKGWDLVHIYQEPYIFAGWQTAFWTPEKTPFVFFTAQNLTKTYPPPFSWMERYCLNRCAGWIGCGATVIESRLEQGYGKRPYRLIGFGVDTAEFRPDRERRQRMRTHLGWDDSIPVVACLGRLVPVKGIEFLTSVLDGIHVPWRALFIGTGPLQPALEKWSMNYPDRVRIVAASHGDVPAYLNAADILCAPSQTLPNSKEQFGRMIVEGFASGLAVISSDSGELPYVTGDAGIVAGEKDRAAWIDNLERLLPDVTLRADFGERARARIASHFTWPVIARQHIEFFEELLAARK